MLDTSLGNEYSRKWSSLGLQQNTLELVDKEKRKKNQTQKKSYQHMKQIVQKGSRHEKRLGDKAYRYSTNKGNHRVDKYTSFSTLSYKN